MEPAPEPRPGPTGIPFDTVFSKIVDTLAGSFRISAFKFSTHYEQLEEYEIQSAKNIILKKQNNVEEDELIQYLSKKGYSLDSIRTAIQDK